VPRSLLLVGSRLKASVLLIDEWIHKWVSFLNDHSTDTQKKDTRWSVNSFSGEKRKRLKFRFDSWHAAKNRRDDRLTRTDQLICQPRSEMEKMVAKMSMEVFYEGSF